MKQPPHETQRPRQDRRIAEIADAVLARREARDPEIALSHGHTPRKLGSVAEATVQEDAAFFADCLRQLGAIDETLLSRDQSSFLQALRIDLANRVAAARFYWLDFVITPYTGGDMHVAARAALIAHPLGSREQLESFVALVRDYARLLTEIRDKTALQAARGVRLSAPAISLARSTLRDVLEGLHRTVIPDRERLDALEDAERGRLVRTLTQLIERQLAPPLEQVLTLLDDDYAARAPAQVGLWQYPDGLEYYECLIRQRAESDLSAQAIHELGLRELECIAATQSRLRGELAPRMDCEDFERMVRTDARWRITAPAEAEARFSQYMRRIEPLLPKWFKRLPKAPWAVKRADPAVESGMSYGYYQRPKGGNPAGCYYYNGGNLERRSFIGAAHLIYHELLPGHHLQLSLEQESKLAHPLQPHLSSTASAEGWAVYASQLACEMGLIAGFDHYGHCLMQGLLAARLVVDTGLNALGWTLERARLLLRERTLESQETIDSELLRYSTDIPAQALAYDLGRYAITGLRRGARDSMGAAFDLRSFHDTVLEVGALPLVVIKTRIDEFTQQSTDPGAAPRCEQ